MDRASHTSALATPPHAPKVAWATEGLAKIHMATGNLEAAMQEFERAVNIRRCLQDEHPEQEVFTKELNSLETSVAQIFAPALRNWASRARRSGRERAGAVGNGLGLSC